MSKAFTKDDGAETAAVVPPRAPLPEGVKNYVTARGLTLLRDELRALQLERAGLDAAADDAAKQKVPVVVARLAELERRLAVATRVDASEIDHDVVRFGATVTLQSDAGVEKRFQIVGVDEADADRGRVAFVAPLARAVLGRRVGDVAKVRAPKGDDAFEIVAIDYGDMEEGGRP
jgi:transcription elongation factor GreB